MKKILLIAFTLALLTVSLSITAVADSKSGEVQACVALGVKPDVCANCLIAGIDRVHGRLDLGDYGPCFCKFDPQLRAQFPNMGACVSYVQQNGPWPY